MGCRSLSDASCRREQRAFGSRLGEGVREESGMWKVGSGKWEKESGKRKVGKGKWEKESGKWEKERVLMPDLA